MKTIINRLSLAISLFIALGTLAYAFSGSRVEFRVVWTNASQEASNAASAADESIKLADLMPLPARKPRH